MGAKVTFNPVTHEIQVTLAPTNGITSLDFKIDVYSDGKEDWLADTELAKHEFPIEAVGGNSVPGDKFLDVTFFILAPWQFLPYDANHELLINGNVYRDDGSSIAKARAGRTITVTLNTTFSAGVSTNDMAYAVWANHQALTLGKFVALK